MFYTAAKPPPNCCSAAPGADLQVTKEAAAAAAEPMPALSSGGVKHGEQASQTYIQRALFARGLAVHGIVGVDVV